MSLLTTAQDHLHNHRYAEALAGAQQLLKLGMNKEQAQHVLNQATLQLALVDLHEGHLEKGLGALEALADANPEWIGMRIDAVDWRCNTQPMANWGNYLNFDQQGMTPQLALTVLEIIALWSWYSRKPSRELEHMLSQTVRIINHVLANNLIDQQETANKRRALAKTIEICRNFTAFLAHLVPHAPAPEVDPALPKLWAIGDSHVLSCLGQRGEVFGQAWQVDTSLVRGVKAFHLKKGKPHIYKTMFQAQWDALPPASTVLVSVGEIDCRHNEGIWTNRAQYKTIADAIEATFAPMFAYLASREGGHRIIIQGVPTPHAEHIAQIKGGPQHDFAAMVKHVNTFMAEQAKAHGFAFLDVYAMTNDGRGVGNGQWHLENIHLKPGAVPHALANHLVEA